MSNGQAHHYAGAEQAVNKTPSARPETETIDKLFLELSQFTAAKTAREIALEERANVAGKLVADIFNDMLTELRPSLHTRASDFLMFGKGERGGLLDTPSAMLALTTALQQDADYAWSWHCNLAMSFYDEMKAHSIYRDEIALADLHKMSNAAAARFMKLCFSVDTSKNPAAPR